MTVLIVAEKPSAAKHMAEALGGMSGERGGTRYRITHLLGHLYEFKQPQEMAPNEPPERYEKWRLDTLPWDASSFDWSRTPRKGARDVIATVRKDMREPDVDEICCATDLDPSGEGDLLFWEVIDAVRPRASIRLTRMEFVDESPDALRKSFDKRRDMADEDKEPGLRKALFRDKFDYLSMQFSRVATLSCPRGTPVLRQGRLKSAMVVLVGDQLKAHDEYVRHPYWQLRYKDENGVMYTNPRADKTTDRKEAERLAAGAHAGPVIPDGTERKHGAPPRLLDLASLSARLAPKGLTAKTVLDTYQKMYEDRVVSYPRTEDHNVTRGQFDELLPLTDRIAAVVGVDAGLLTHREPRSTHVVDKGAHGANRPGPNVPRSLDMLDDRYGKGAADIYRELARSWLAMLAPDCEWDRVSGHVGHAPEFKGAVNVMRVRGWRDVFDAQDDAQMADKGLGMTASPFAYEGANPRPAAPTVKWLMAQLATRNVGTGATRTSIYADASKADAKGRQLIKETRGRLTLAPAGRISYGILPGTHIGDVGTTETVYKWMDDVSKGANPAPLLDTVAQWVRDDKETMWANAAGIRKEAGMTDRSGYAEGEWNGEHVHFKRTWSGHEFTDKEVEDLLAGKDIVFKAHSSRTGHDFTAAGHLEHQTFTAQDGREVKYVGFKVDWNKVPEDVPDTFCGHTFTEEEKKSLRDGETIHVDNMKSKKGSVFGADLRWGDRDDGRKGLILDFGH